MTRFALLLLLVPTLVAAIERPTVSLTFTDEGTYLFIAGQWDTPDFGDIQSTTAIHLYCAVDIGRTCWEGNATLHQMKDGKQFLKANASVHDRVDLWSDNLIVLTTEKNRCRTTQVIIDRATKSVTRVTKQNKKTCPDQANKNEPDSSKATLVGKRI
jgi:hypothetical protein